MTVTLTNLIPSPSMEGSGWAGGTYSTDYALVGTRSLKLDGTASTPEATANTTASITLNPTHTYYARVYAYQPVQIGTVGFYWPIAEPNFGDGLPVGPAEQWNLYSVVNTRSTFTAGSYRFRLDFNNNSVAGSTYFDGCMLIDLTAAFGAGKEPDKLWCDQNVLYFEGTQQIEVYEVQTINVSNAEITPNPVAANQTFTLKIYVDEVTALMQPAYRYAGELYAQEE